jgi:hypothetical protein
LRVLEEPEARWKEMSEREIQCSDTQAKQDILRKADNKVEDCVPARADNNPE